MRVTAYGVVSNANADRVRREVAAHIDGARVLVLDLSNAVYAVSPETLLRAPPPPYDVIGAYIVTPTAEPQLRALSQRLAACHGIVRVVTTSVEAALKWAASISRRQALAGAAPLALAHFD